jgi:hypothetical protein
MGDGANVAGGATPNGGAATDEGAAAQLTALTTTALGCFARIVVNRQRGA